MLKDLPFYEVAHKTNTKARQERLDQREKKCQEGTLRQAPGGSHPATSSIVHSPTKKKSAPQLNKKVLDLFPSASTSVSSFTVGTEQGSTDSPSIGANQGWELEYVVPYIILEPEEEEKEVMASNLRVGFKGRQSKRLSKSIVIAPLPAKRTCAEDPYAVPVSDTLLAPMPPSDAARSS